MCLTNAFDLPLLVQIVPTHCEHYLLKVIWESNKPFTATGISTAQRLMQTAAGSVIDIPKKNTRLQISAPLDFSHISHLGPGSGPFNSKIIDCKCFEIFGLLFILLQTSN